MPSISYNTFADIDTAGELVGRTRARIMRCEGVKIARAANGRYTLHHELHGYVYASTRAEKTT